MRAARLREAAHEAFIAAVQEDYAHVVPAHAQLVHDLGELAQRVAAARVRADGDLLLAARLRRFDQRRNEVRREVVDAEEMRVLQRLQCHALPGAGNAREQDDLHQASPSPRITSSWRLMKSAVELMPRVMRIWLRTAASTSTARLRPRAPAS